MNALAYTLMEGLGNTFAVVDARSRGRASTGTPVAPTLLSPAGAGVGLDRSALARAVCAAEGVDGLLAIDGARDASHDVSVEIWNADGSPGGMCGNGVRCVALLLAREGAEGRKQSEGSGAGLRELIIAIAGRRVVCRVVEVADGGRAGWVDVNMGAAVLELGAVPVDASRADRGGAADPPRLRVGGEWGVAVSFGNPHFVVFVDGGEVLPEGDALASRGRALELHEAFPQRTNAHFARVESGARIVMRPWERGVGATAACASGACAVFSAARALGRCDAAAVVVMPGGELSLREGAHGDVWCAGPATVMGTGAGHPDDRPPTA